MDEHFSVEYGLAAHYDWNSSPIPINKPITIEQLEGIIHHDHGHHSHENDDVGVGVDDGHHDDRIGQLINNIGYCHQFGLFGAVKNEKKACEWYRRGANMNNEFACFNIGLCYRDGLCMITQSSFIHNPSLHPASNQSVSIDVLIVIIAVPRNRQCAMPWWRRAESIARWTEAVRESRNNPSLGGGAALGWPLGKEIKDDGTLDGTPANQRGHRFGASLQLHIEKRVQRYLTLSNDPTLDDASQHIIAYTLGRIYFDGNNTPHSPIGL
jgi:hypothetical protein